MASKEMKLGLACFIFSFSPVGLLFLALHLRRLFLPSGHSASGHRRRGEKERGRDRRGENGKSREGIKRINTLKFKNQSR